MEFVETSKELISFINECHSMFHSVKTIREMLEKEGYAYLPETGEWNLEKGGKYYTVRNHSSVIAFRIGKNLNQYQFRMTASHSDSPTFKVKNVAEMNGPGEYLRLDTEGYGGMIDSSWFDRPLTVAGRVLCEVNGKIETRLLYIDKDILMIPNVAIHFNRDINSGYKYNHQVDLLPLFSNGKLKKGSFDEMIAKELGIEKDQILGKDLFLVNREKGRIWGYADEFVSSPKLDDLQCAFAALKGFLSAINEETVSLYACFDNEEVGSNTEQGAMSTFLKTVTERINSALGYNQDDYYQAVAKSFMVSCDNAHAVHPNHVEKTDTVNCSYMNKGIVIKENASQRYTTDAFSRAVFTKICKDAGVPVQYFANRSDMPGGSTLGNLSNIQVSVHAVDIGLPQLAMHSSYETAGVEDTAWAIEGLKAYYNSHFEIEDELNIQL